MARNDTLAMRLFADSSQFQDEMAKAQRTIRRLERQVARSKKGMGGAFGPIGKSLRGLAGPLAGAAAGFGSVAGASKLLEESVSATQDLAKATGRLTAMTGMDVKTASAWVSMAKARGISTDQLTVLFKTSQKQIAGLSDGTKTAVEAFDRLGIAQKDLAGLSFDQQLLRISEGLKGIQDPAERSKIAFQLFGRQAGKVFALMASGKVELGQQVEWFKRYGATMDRSTLAAAKRLTVQQQRMNAMMDKIKVTIGSFLIPVVARAQAWFVTLAVQFQRNEGRGGRLRRTIAGIANALRQTWQQARPVVSVMAKLISQHPGLAVFAAKVALVSVATNRMIRTLAAAKVAIIALQSTARRGGRGIGRSLIAGIAIGVVLGLPEFLKDLGQMLWNSVKDPNVILHGGNVTKGSAWNKFKSKYGLAMGGVVRSPRIAMIGEAGPEAVVPLTRPRRARAVMAEAGLLGGGGGHTFNITNVNGQLDEQALARSIGWQLATRGLA